MALQPANSAVYLPFESELAEHDRKIREIEELSRANKMDFSEELRVLRERRVDIVRKAYSNLGPWERIQVSRHERRPQTRDYLDLIFTDFMELSGDRMFADDLAIVAGLARLGDERVMVIGQHKGRNVRERHLTNAGSPHPEGYRKAMLKMRLAERFALPVVCLIDTKGAFPGTGAEERGQAAAIAENLRDMSVLRVPVVAVVIGEGGSGGALGIGVADRLLMMEYAYYSVISPEGCAAILWKSASNAAEAAAALKITAGDLAEMKIIDEIVKEPLGGAHQDPKAAADTLKAALLRNLAEIKGLPVDRLLAERYARLRRHGVWMEGAAASAPAAAGGSGEARK
ncbi:MAG TPA: acetyl-CoA carboxylase carboxyltransferase subunit alpha [Planctomycetota bacterium]|nr:acetyl-CoA carboxylase carboxyltransferase subunit alpha [Planctomycetota bacterium]